MQILLLIVMNLFWSGSYTVMKWGTEYLNPIHLLYLRIVVSFIVMLVFSFNRKLLAPPKIIFRCAMIGGVIAIAHGFYLAGINMSHATDGVILYALEPISAIIYARILLKEKMDAQRVVALILAIIGFSILSEIWRDDLLKNLTLIGNILMVIGILADGSFSAVAKPAVKEYPARTILTLSLLFTIIFLTPFALAVPVHVKSFTWQLPFIVFYLAIPCTVIGWTVWLSVLRDLPVNVMTLTVFLQPVFGPFISYFALGEQIGMRLVFGGSVILLAVAVAVFRKRKIKEEIFDEPAMP